MKICYLKSLGINNIMMLDAEEDDNLFLVTGVIKSMNSNYCNTAPYPTIVSTSTCGPPTTISSPPLHSPPPPQVLKDYTYVLAVCSSQSIVAVYNSYANNITNVQNVLNDTPLSKTVVKPGFIVNFRTKNIIAFTDGSSWSLTKRSAGIDADQFPNYAVTMTAYDSIGDYVCINYNSSFSISQESCYSNIICVSADVLNAYTLALSPFDSTNFIIPYVL